MTDLLANRLPQQQSSRPGGLFFCILIGPRVAAYGSAIQVRPLILQGGSSWRMISCGCVGLASCHCVCQNVLGLPSTAFAPLPSSATVSSLSTLTSFTVSFCTPRAAGP